MKCEYLESCEIYQMEDESGRKYCEDKSFPQNPRSNCSAIPFFREYQPHFKRIEDFVKMKEENKISNE